MAEDDVPPLDDMSDMLERVLNTANKKSAETKKVLPPNTSTETSKSLALTTQDVVSKEESKPPSFGGMKKGFLFCDKPKKPTSASGDTVKQNSTTSDDLPYISRKPEADSKFRFDEVQAATRGLNEALLQNQGDLLKNIEKNETLCKRILDPSFMAAIAEFQKNPEAAMEKYKDNLEIQKFFKDFCSVVGDHLTSLGDQKLPDSSNKPSDEVKLHGDADATISEISTRRYNELPMSEEDRRVKEILENQEIKSILLDPKIRQLIDALRSDPQMAERLLRLPDPEFHSRIRQLVQAGLLQLHS